MAHWWHYGAPACGNCGRRMDTPGYCDSRCQRYREWIDRLVEEKMNELCDLHKVARRPVPKGKTSHDMLAALKEAKGFFKQQSSVRIKVRAYEEWAELHPD